MKKIKAGEFRLKVKHLGRTWYYEKEDVLYTNWTNSGVEFLFSGRVLIADFVADFGLEIEGMPWDENPPTRENWPHFAVFIDDEKVPYRSFVIDKPNKTELIAEFNDDKPHRIVIRKITENVKTYGGIRSLFADGVIEESKGSDKKKIEFIGDSITCGFGVGTKERDRAFFASEENGILAHPYLAAERLGMELSQVSVSGICAFHCNGLPNEFGMDELFPYADRPIQRKLGYEERGEAIDKWDFKANPKDYVVVNLGTNDASNLCWVEDKEKETELFLKGYKGLINTIRESYGSKTVIICALGPLIYYFYKEICDIVDEIKKETGDANIYTYRYQMIHPMDGFGALGHPSLITQEKMADEIAGFIGGLK